MKRLLLILSFAVISTWACAQEEIRIVDSLESILPRQEGRERVETMIELSKAFFDFSFDDCINWGEKAIEEAKKMNDNQLTAIAYGEIGIHYLNHYEFDLSKSSFENAEILLADGNDSILWVDVLNYKGRVELFMGDLDLALSTFQRDLEISECLGKELNCADLINNMAYIYFQQGDLEQSLDCFNDARLRYERLDDTLSAAQCDNNISNIYVEKQQFDEAMKLLQKAIPVFEQYDDEASLAHAYQNLGTVYALGHVNLDSAMYYLQKSIVCAENVGDEMTLVEDEIELANVFKRLGRDKEAIMLYQSALQASESMGYQNGILDAYRHLGIHYNETGDFTTSAIYLKRCMDLASEKGNQLYVNSVRPYLIADYASLGRFAEMSKELGLFRDNYENILGESKALDAELARLSDNVEGLLTQYESQSEQIQALRSQRDRYRLAFFGLLTIVFAAIVFWLIRKIFAVLEKRMK